MSDEKIRVLVTDDEEDFRQLMSFWLTTKGYSVLQAENGEKAIEVIKKEAPQVVFMDMRMPVVDGAEAVRRIREFNKEVPIIVISAYVDDPNVKEAMKYGISGVFNKGKDFEEGLALLEVALKTHRGLRK